MSNTYLPNANLIAVIGEFGAGKSLYMVELGLRLANAYKKKIVTNFRLNLKAVKEYCRLYKLDWFYQFGRIINIDFQNVGIESIWSYPQSVCLVDELGNWASARDWSKMGAYFRNNLNQVRHSDIHLLCGYQFFGQVDNHVRELIQHFCICFSTGKYSVELRAPKITARYVFHYSPKVYFAIQNPQTQAKAVKPWRAALCVEWNSLIFNRFKAELKNLITIYIDILKNRYHNSYRRMISSREDLLFKCFSTKALIGVGRPKLDNIYQFPSSDPMSKCLVYQKKKNG